MSISRRHFLKLSGTTLAVLAAGLEVDVPKLHAAGHKLKLKDAKEFNLPEAQKAIEELTEQTLFEIYEDMEGGLNE